MKPTARFFNVGRGALVDEPAMIEALESGTVARRGSRRVSRASRCRPRVPLWGMDNVFVSPHMSGDYHGDTVAMAQVFLEELQALPGRGAAPERRRQAARIRPPDGAGRDSGTKACDATEPPRRRDAAAGALRCGRPPGLCGLPIQMDAAPVVSGKTHIVLVPKLPELGTRRMSPRVHVEIPEHELDERTELER